MIYRKDRTARSLRLAHVCGGVIDPEKTKLRADPKAVTFHQFALKRVDGVWRTRIVIDI